MKLYVETENKVAIKVYEKLGMVRTEETIFEDDFVFHPIK
jgi:RimJ/RimL family protein N-acetyltransferase